MSIIQKIKKIGEGYLIRAVAEPRLITIQLDITNACNLSCKHCYHSHHMNTGALRLQDWLAILIKIQTFMDNYKLYPRFMFCGGEPLLSPLMKPMAQEISRIWPAAEMVVLTNGTILRESVFDVMPRERTSFQVSLDGPDAVRHDSVRGAGNFKKSLAGISKFLERGYSVSVLSILSQRTSGWIGDYFDLAKDMRVSAQNFTRLIAEGHGKKLVDDGIDFPLAGLDLKHALTRIILESFRTGVPTNTNQPLYALLDRSFGQNGLFGFDSLVIDYKGNLKVTSRTGAVLGNVLTEDLDEIYIRNQVLVDIRNKKIDVCGSCDLYDSCGGDRNAAYAEYGSYTARDPGCWKYVTH
jgi:radical SAM protein with 4Fe4S-binding SPASM domain